MKYAVMILLVFASVSGSGEEAEEPLCVKYVKQEQFRRIADEGTFYQELRVLRSQCRTWIGDASVPEEVKEQVCSLAVLGFSEVSRRSFDWDRWLEESAPYPHCVRWMDKAMDSVRRVQTRVHKDAADALGM